MPPRNSNAWEYAAGLHQKVILIDGLRLAIDHNIDVAEEQVYRLMRIDSDYFLNVAVRASALYSAPCNSE